MSKPTLAISLGRLFELDAPLWRAAVEQELAIINAAGAPAREFADVALLAAYEKPADGSGAVYLIVGVVHGVRLTGKGKTLAFESVERFIRPIVVSSEATDDRRADLIGDIKGWSANGFYYLPAGAADDAIQEAAASLRPSVRRPPPSAGAAPAGMHRVHLTGDDGDRVTVYLPLDVDGRILRSAPQPWLLKAVLDGIDFLGELKLGAARWNHIRWDVEDEPDSLIDLGTAPFRVGSPVRLHDGPEEDTDRRDFVVRSMQRV